MIRPGTRVYVTPDDVYGTVLARSGDGMLCIKPDPSSGWGRAPFVIHESEVKPRLMLVVNNPTLVHADRPSDSEVA